MHKTMLRLGRHPAHALGCGLWLATLAALPGAAEVQLAGESGERPPVTELRVGPITTTGTRPETGADAGLGAADAASVRPRLEVENLQSGAGGAGSHVAARIIILEAEGQGAVSRMALGTIGDTTAGGRVTNSVTLGTSYNIAIGAGARACTEIGTLGRSGFCE